MSIKQKIKIFGQIIETFSRNFYFFEYIFSENQTLEGLNQLCNQKYIVTLKRQSGLGNALGNRLGNWGLSKNLRGTIQRVTTLLRQFLKIISKFREKDI